jgi:hypothetical protein
VQWRPWIIGSVLLVVLATNIYLVLEEGQEGRIPRSETNVAAGEAPDPLAGKLSFVSSADRKSNFQRILVKEDLVKKAMKAISRYDDSEGLTRNRLDDLLRSVEEDEALGSALCTPEKTPSRYAMLPFLITGSGQRLDIINLKTVGGLELGDWSASARIEGVYQSVELVDEPEPDASLMGLAAILLNQQDDAINRLEPWGRGRKWEWDGVEKTSRTAADLITSYVALYQLTAEVAFESADGYCGEG